MVATVETASESGRPESPMYVGGAIMCLTDPLQHNGMEDLIHPESWHVKANGTLKYLITCGVS